MTPPPTIWQANPKLKSLLLVLIFVFLISGIGLAVFSFMQNRYRQQLYAETQAGLPKHEPVQSATQLLQDFTISGSQTNGWKVYANAKVGIQFEFPLMYTTTGQQAKNSVLGRVDEPVAGIFVGPFVIVRLITDQQKSQAKQYMSIGNGLDQPLNEGDMPPPVCDLKNIPNASAEITYIYCTGEGGPAYYAYIKGKNSEWFLDGYSCGWDSAQCGDLYGAGPGRFAKSEDVKRILSTFTFTK